MPKFIEIAETIYARIWFWRRLQERTHLDVMAKITEADPLLLATMTFSR